MATLAEEVIDILTRLPPDKQRRALAFVRSLDQAIPAPISTPPPGAPGSSILKYHPKMSLEDAEAMERAINKA
jgi:hypothetical protein